MANLNDVEVDAIFNLYRRGNTIPGGDFPTRKNGLELFIREANPGYLVDQGTMEYMRSQHLQRFYDLPVSEDKIRGFGERLKKLRTEFYERSVLPESLRNGFFGVAEKVIVQGELGEIFYKELKKNNYDAKKAEEATRNYYERAWPALERGYSLEDLKKGMMSGEYDLNGPEGHVFDLPNATKKIPIRRDGAEPEKKLQPLPVPSEPENSPEHKSGPISFDSPFDNAWEMPSLRRSTAPTSNSDTNPFNLDRSNLKQQAELLKSNPLRARQLILAAGRDPGRFGFA